MRRLNKVNLIDEAHVLLFYMMLPQKLKVYWVLQAKIQGYAEAQHIGSRMIKSWKEFTDE